MLHSLIDFSLQIPGYSIVALSLIGAGLAQSFVGERNRNGAGNGAAAIEGGDPARPASALESEAARAEAAVP